MLLDGDNLRSGLNKDLGFSPVAREENIRRAGEVAKLMVDAGLIVICAFISPFEEERAAVRRLFAADEFLEIFVDAPLEACIARDPKGLYKRALAGELPNFTGVSQPFERPANPEMRVRSDLRAVDEIVDSIMELLRAKYALAVRARLQLVGGAEFSAIPALSPALPVRGESSN